MKPTTIRVSECCLVPAKSNGDFDSEDLSTCPECGGSCNYIDVDPDQESEEDEISIDNKIIKLKPQSK